MIDTLDSKNPNTCQKSGRFVTSKLSRREASRAPPSGNVGFRLAFKNAISQAAQLRERRDYASLELTSTSERLHTRYAVRQGTGGTDRAQQPAARGGSSSLSVAAAAQAEPRQPQDAGGGPRRGNPSVADGTCVAASTERRQPRARAAVAATAAERRRAAVAAVTRGPGRRRARR